MQNKGMKICGKQRSPVHSEFPQSNEFDLVMKIQNLANLVKMEQISIE